MLVGWGFRVEFFWVIWVVLYFMISVFRRGSEVSVLFGLEVTRVSFV